MGDFEYSFFQSDLCDTWGRVCTLQIMIILLVVWVCLWWYGLTDCPMKFNKIKSPGVLNPIVCNKLILYSLYLRFLEVTQKIGTVESLCRVLNIPVFLFPVSFWMIVLLYYHRTVYYHRSGALDVNVP